MPPTVYLDTQDYSKFGDVLRGDDRNGLDQTFGDLCQLAEQGRATFVYSMPILSELLQYDAAHEDTTRAKAEVVERLCRGHAIAYPPRILAYEAASFAHSHGILRTFPAVSLISDDNFWFPDIGDVLESFRTNLSNQATEALARFKHLPRNQRRALKKKTQPRYRNRALDDAVPEIAVHYGLEVSDLRSSIILLLKGKISSREASKRLFSAVQRPTSFIDVYFKHYDGPKDLPFMLRGPGEKMAQSLDRFKAEITSESRDLVRSLLPPLLEGWKSELGRVLLEAIDGGEGEFGLTEAALTAVRNHESAVYEIPSCQMVAAVVRMYAEQVIGLHGPPAKTERSLAGDLVHALYLPHVDVWRGDARFCEIIRKAK
jgi:hypothetical protein